ncbi:hypothetical protein [Labrys wisconsinensis]|uniref:Uncharacterized protein n=1 Tax=Labrys wisconsinensis TaxID=425677 RepID=A0ABU0JFX1_9HYPH|nr:hypothetical protein [Labrys wisconsinensis]MDQ0473180.1 hypothetical protein [Labrys wisconsinensis]
MKLSPVRIDRTLGQIDAQPVPPDHPAQRQFVELFGDHTFFLDGSGLAIVEPAEAHVDGMETGRVVKLAGWTDEKHNRLVPHPREDTDVVVVIGKAA